MARFVVEYAAWTGRAAEQVDALDARREGPWLVLEDVVPVVGRPRWVVALRVATVEVALLRRVR